MRKYIFLVTLLLLLSGCPSGNDGTSPLDTSYRTGTSALVLSFLTNSPPSTVFDTDEFPIGIEVRNKGAYEVTDGKIHLEGYDKNIISVSGDSFSGDLITLNTLPGKSIYNPDGSYAVYSLSAKIVGQEVPDSHRPTFKAEACYTYATVAVADLCIDTEINSPDSIHKTCTTGDITFSGGQGAPLEITSIRVGPSSKKVSLTIYFRNSGGGEIYDKRLVGECSTGRIPTTSKNIVNVDYVKVGSQDITSSCKPGNIVTIPRGADGVIWCDYEYPAGQTGTYKTPLSIKLSYGYRSYVLRTVEIFKSP
ncbi:MAG: hypothetical protein JRI71_17385 [Deltaproteobacteria bacterium]|nr:hypothetical protein [Deltaproteobacteria bacterium]